VHTLITDLTPLVKSLLLPPGGAIVLAIVGLVIGIRWRTLGRIITATAIAALYLLSTPLVAGWLVATLNDAPPLESSSARRAQAIVVLGAGLSSDMSAPNGVTLGPLTSERVRYAALLSKQHQLPLAVSGGAPIGRAAEVTEAGLMQSALEKEYGTPVKWIEAQSRNTRENATLTATLLLSDGVATVLLVTHPFDVRRARSEFEAAGLAVISAPTQVSFPQEFGGQDLLPSIWAVLNSHFAMYEVLAMIKASVR